MDLIGWFSQCSTDHARIGELIMDWARVVKRLNDLAQLIAEISTVLDAHLIEGLTAETRYVLTEGAPSGSDDPSTEVVQLALFDAPGHEPVLGPVLASSAADVGDARGPQQVQPGDQRESPVNVRRTPQGRDHSPRRR